MFYLALLCMAALAPNVVLGAIVGFDSPLVALVTLPVAFWLGRLAGIAIAEDSRQEVHP